MLKRKNGQLIRALNAEKVATGWVLTFTICPSIPQAMEAPKPSTGPNKAVKLVFRPS